MPDQANSNEPKVSRFREAYERALPEMQALQEDEILAINIDIPTAVTTALGALPELSALRGRAAQLPDFEVEKFDKLELYTLATGHAHALFLGASAPTGALQEMSDTATKLRELLHSDALVLSKRGLIDVQRLKELKGPVGYRNLAFDLLALVAIMRERWEAIQGKTASTATELEQAETIADQLLSAVGTKEQAPQLVAAAVDMRQRAFTLFINAYDQARRVAKFLRWSHEDADTIVPSLYAGRHTRRRTEAADTQAPAQATAPAAQPAVQQAAAAQPPANAAGVGLPGSNPFAQ